MSANTAATRVSGADPNKPESIRSIVDLGDTEETYDAPCSIDASPDLTSGSAIQEDEFLELDNGDESDEDSIDPWTYAIMTSTGELSGFSPIGPAPRKTSGRR